MAGERNVHLYGEPLRQAALAWRKELGDSDRERLDRLVNLAVSERIRLADCLATLFPRFDATKAQTALAKLCERLNVAAEGDGDQKANLGLSFHMDEGSCWFTGPDPAVQHAERYSKEATSPLEGKEFIPARGIATTSTALEEGKRLVRFFVSYAHLDKALADSLVEKLKIEFKPSKTYQVQLWFDGDILVGENWDARIKAVLDACDFGLLLVSPSFLGSEFISKEELPRLVGPTGVKPIIPVGLSRVDFDRHDLKGLERNQFFFRPGRQGMARCYERMRSDVDKREFAHELFLKIEKRLDAFFGQWPIADPALPRQPDVPDGKDFADLVARPEPASNFQRTRALPINLGDQESIDPATAAQQAKSSQAQARDALDELRAWAIKPDAPPFFALLGEYGIGKTTTLSKLTRVLLDERKKNSALPLPIYVDLRAYTGDARVPTIEQLLASVIERKWSLTERVVTAQELLRLVREEGAIILFDGLDERIVHLRTEEAQAFIRTLWSALPAATQPEPASTAGKCRGKLLISCRSHYFRDVWSQNAMLTGEEREGIERRQFPALCLLPFTEEQIEGYLQSVLGSTERATHAMELIASIHNLRELAERPVLLKLISDHLGELEALRTRGETVNAARLYELVVRSWLERDNGKHQLEPAHKRRMMEDLAATLWREGTKQWDADRLERWLDQYFLVDPVVANAYMNKNRVVLKEDLRTATFVLRPDTEQKDFRFAHTSLQEYFLAAYLVRALVDGKPERWDLPMVSLEMLDFLGQILALEPKQAAAISTLETILCGDVLNAAVIAFRYWLRAIQQGMPVPAPKKVKLAGANLEGWKLRGRSSEQPLNLRGADLSRVWLSRILLASPEAWRWLGWRSRDPDTGELRILPAEAFGPLPVAPT